MRLSEACEACDGALDSTMTSQLGVEGLLRLLWCLTRQPPTVNIPSLRVDHYSTLNTKLRLRHEWLLQQTDDCSDSCSVTSVLKKIKCCLDVTDQFMKDLADPLGFDPSWMTVKLGKAAAKARQIAAAKNQARLPPLLAQSQPVAVPTPPISHVPAVPPVPQPQHPRLAVNVPAAPIALAPAVARSVV